MNLVVELTPLVRMPKYVKNFEYFVDRASRYNRVKENQLDAQLVLSILYY
jgi:hypothetical protein